MKPLSIKLQLLPFDTTPGVPMFVPGSHWVCRIYPAKVSFFSFETREAGEVSLPVQGPVKNFHVQANLERGRLEVSGLASQGFFRFFLSSQKGKLLLERKKGEISSMSLCQSGDLVCGINHDVQPIERKLPALSLGIHKKQDWAFIARRCDPKEFLPFWLRWSYWVPPTVREDSVDEVNPLLQELMGASPDDAFCLLQRVFLGCFYGMFIPQKDDGGLALVPEGQEFQNNLLRTLHLGAQYIESRFFLEEEGGFYLLPFLPKEFHAGRYLRFLSSQGDQVSIEWSKKKIKRVFFSCAKTRWIQWRTKASQTVCRLSRKGERQESEQVLIKKPLLFEAGKDYCLDNFRQ